MRISLNWLKRYVDVPCSAKELGHKLTMVGFPVPSVEAVGDVEVLLEMIPQREIKERRSGRSELHAGGQTTLHEGQVASS